jgi:hypothetical protein
MKKLELKQMENLEGGVDCSSGLGFAVGFTAMFAIATIATGGATLLALGTIAAAGGGSILSVGNCRDTGWL